MGVGTEAMVPSVDVPICLYDFILYQKITDIETIIKTVWYQVSMHQFVCTIVSCTKNGRH